MIKKEEEKIFSLTYRNSKWSSCKVIYEGGLPNNEEMHKYFPIYDEAFIHICNCSIKHFFIYEENLIVFFISA